MGGCGNWARDYCSCTVVVILCDVIPLNFAKRLTGKSPFLQDSDEATISAITSSSALDFSSEDFSNVYPKAQDFISCGLTKNPRRRPTPQQCQHHHWLLESCEGRRASVGQISPIRTRGSPQQPHLRRTSSGGEKSKPKLHPLSADGSPRL